MTALRATPSDANMCSTPALPFVYLTEEDGMSRVEERVRRGRPAARWTAADMAEVVEAVLRSRPDRTWSAEDLRERLAFGREGGPALSSVREALRALEHGGRAERVSVWGLQGWGNTAVAYRPRAARDTARLSAAA